MIQLEKWRYSFIAVALLAIVIVVCAQLTLQTLPVIETGYPATFVFNKVNGATDYLIQWTTNTATWPKNQFVQTKTNVVKAGKFQYDVTYYARIKVLEPQPGSYWTQPIMFMIGTGISYPSNNVALVIDSAPLSSTNWRPEWVVVLTNVNEAKQFKLRAFKP